MYAIVEIAGKQFRVEKDQKLKVPHLQAEGGSKIVFEEVLVYADDQGKTQIGTPVIKNMKVSATVVEHGREKTIIVFKKKRRKGYQKKNGHRQGYSIIKIDDIGVVKAAPKAKPKTKTEEDKPAKAPAKAQVKEAQPKAEKAAKAKAPVKKAAPAKKEATVKKEATPKKAAAKKDKPAEEKEA